MNEVNYDIAIIGAGPAGLSAAVEAANKGSKVVLLESRKFVGGNWGVSYGLMGVNSPLSKKQGIKINVNKLLNNELRLFNYQVDATLWKDLINSSGDNIAWLQDQGVEFESEIEPYITSEISAPVYHRWKKSSQPTRKMQIAFEKAGGTVMLETKAKKFLMENGKICGIIATNKNGNEVQINCKAAISCGGGYVDNVEWVSRIVGIEDYEARNIGDNDGSAIKMSLEAGARSLMGYETIIADLIPREMKVAKDWVNYIHNRPGDHPFHVNVNQDGQRYVDESCTLKLFGLDPAAAITQLKTFRVYDEDKLKELDAFNNTGMYDMLMKAVADGKYGIFKANTFKELAEHFNLDPKTFTETMNQYNDYCKAGIDDDFEKNSAYLKEFKPPFYMWENGFQIPATFSSLDYNKNMEALNNNRRVIPGLYIAGCDGAKIYRDYYSLAIPGSAMANNIYTGRKAGEQASIYSAKA